jgi:hypothetical protein
MKQTFFKLRTASIILALSGLMITLSVPSFAGNKNIEILSGASVQPSVKFLGTDNNSASFLVQLDAAAPVKFELNIKDKAGVSLFSQVFEAATFSKTFKMLTDGDANLQLTFTVKTLPDGKLNSFAVSTQEKTVTEVVVTKAK